MSDLNTVAFTGRLAMNPELRETRNGTPVANLRVVINDPIRKDDGSWDTKPNFVNVTVFGNQAEGVSKTLVKGSRIAVAGRLSWREWTTESGSKGQALEVVGQVTYLDTKAQTESLRDRSTEEPVPVTSAPASDDSIPF